MAKTGKIFKLYLVLCIWRHVYGLRPFVMDFESLSYEFNSDIMTSLSLKLIDYNDHKAINGTFVFSQDVGDIQFVHWVTVPKARGKLFTLYNFTINGCQFFEGRMDSVNLFARTYLQELKQQIPDIPKKCPFKKDKEYAVMHFYLNEEMFPPYLPTVKFNAFMGMLRGNGYVFEISIKANIASTRSVKT